MAGCPTLWSATAGRVRRGCEGDGLRQELAFDSEATTAAQVLAAVTALAGVVDLAIREPDIEDVVRRIYAVSRTGP